MTPVTLSQPSSQTPPLPVLLIVRAEVVAYVLLLIAALLLRLAMIDVVPLSEAEATRAYSAWHSLHPDSPGIPAPADSALVFWAQRLAFVTMGANEFTARLGGVVAGLLLGALAWLFRTRLGATRTFFFSALLLFNPIALAASRTQDPALWAACCALLAAWAAWQLWEQPTQAHAIWLGIALGGLVFLSGGAGWVYGLVLLLACGLLLWWSMLKAPLMWDITASTLLAEARERVRSIAWRTVLVAAVGVAVLVSTGMMFYPEGLRIVAQSLATALFGWWQPANPTAPLLYPFWVLATYYLAFVLMGVVGYVFLARRGVTRTADRFAVVVALVSGALLAVYQGATAGMTLWVAVPLAWVTAHWLTELLVDRADALYWLITPADRSHYLAAHGWVKWLVGLVTLVLLSIMSFHWQAIGRGILIVNTADYALLLERLISEPLLASFRYSLVWFVVMAIFSVLLGLLAASIWGGDAMWQGLGWGFFAFALVSGLGGGWNATQAQAYPEIWDLVTTHEDTRTLQRTLYEVSMRDTRGKPDLPVVVLVAPEEGITAHGLVAWLLRDYKKARFVNTLADVRRQQIVLLPQSKTQDLDLGGSYVGQSFRLRSHYRIDALDPLRVIGWLAQRRTLREYFTHDDSILWLRMDVYDGVPPSQRLP